MAGIGKDAYLTRNASGDDNDVSALEGLVKLVSGVTVDLDWDEMRLHVAREGRRKPTSLWVSTWETSAATPGAPRIS